MKESKDKSLIAFSTDDGDKEFIDFEDFNEWFNNEVSSFEWLKATVNVDSNISQVWNDYSNWQNSVRQNIKQYNGSSSNASEQQRFLRNLEQTTNSTFDTTKLISSESAAGRFVIGLTGSKERNIVAAYALAMLRGIGMTFQSNYAVEGVYRALDFLRGDRETTQAVVSSLEAAKRSWAARLGKQHKAIKEENEILKDEIFQLRDQIRDQQKLVNELHETQTKTLTTIVEKSKTDYENIKRAFEEEVALHSSVTYWTSKRKHHTTVMFSTAIVTLASALVVASYFSSYIKENLSETISAVPLWKLGIATVIATFGVWLVRLFSKIFVANLHLRTDADERVTMMQTYLAMLKDGVGPKDNERLVILESLFRHSQSGFIKDDGPSSVYELISKLINRK